MPGFHLYRSSSTQSLADRFVETVTAVGATLPVDEDEIVVVQGRGMERWLSHRAAARLGVWAGSQFPFPRAAAADLAARVLGQSVPPQVADDALVLAFVVAAELPALAKGACGERVQHYLRGGSARVLALAQQAAAALDGYLVFRPELLERWSNADPAALEDSDERWQCALWNAVQARARAAGEQSEIARLVDFWPRVRRATQKLASGPLSGVDLPTRVSVFAVAGAAPQLVDFFAALGHACDVHWYAVDPAAQTEGSPAGIVHSLGLADLESVHVVMEAANRAEAAGVSVNVEVLAAAEPRVPASVLARVQRMARVGAIEDRVEGDESRAADRSLLVHACPGPTREVEVLHDELLRAFDELPGLRHEDIAVLVPDIAAYASSIDAVLGGGRGVARIPATIADVSDRDGSSVAAALTLALRLADGDFGLRSVADLLGQPVMAERFAPAGLESDDVVGWLQSAGARRFLDARHRQQAGLPVTDERTWDAALDRLYAGLAAAPGAEDPVPGGSVDPAQPFLLDAASLGRVSEFVELLTALRAMAVEDATGQPRERTMVQWVSEARAVLLRMAPQHGDGEREARALSQQLAGIEFAAVAAGFDSPVPFASARAVLLERLSAARPGRGFLAGGVTVCQLVPMRAVPFRVICMLGMNDTGFPRQTHRVGFDLLSRDQRPGDRDSRAEDRALFLESVLGAGERLVITYPSRELVRGTECAPSTAVAELLDVAAAMDVPRGAAPAQVQAARTSLVVEHPLHAFSVRAWDECAKVADRVGYDAQARKAAELLARGPGEDAHAFLAAQSGAVAVQDADEPIELQTLQSFFRDPAAMTLRALGVRLREANEITPEQEAIEIDAREAGLLRYRLLQEALEHEGRLPETAQERLWRSGDLPLGVFGRAYAGQIVDDVQGVSSEAYPHGFEWRAIDVEAGEFRVVGRVPVVDGAVVVAVASAKVEPRHELRAWILQLAFAVAHGNAPEATIHARNATAVLRAIRGGEASVHLRALCAVMRFGLARGVPFFPGLSETAFWEIRDGASDEEAVAKAADDASGSEDAYSPAARVLFRGVDALTVDLGSVEGVGPSRFVPIALAVLEPMYAVTTGRSATRGGVQP